MKLSKMLRRERAKARFTILSFVEWSSQDKVYVGSEEDYYSYVERKTIEAKALGMTREQLNDAHVFSA